MRALLLCVLFSLALAFAGCAINMTHGTEITAAKLAALTVGTTTLDEVVAQFGKPGDKRQLADGRTLLSYSFSRSRINPPSLATLSGAAPKTELTGIQLTLFVFDPSGHLISYSGERNSQDAAAVPIVPATPAAEAASSTSHS